MIPWTRTERRWRDALFAASIPPGSSPGLPGLAALDLQRFWTLFDRTAPPLVKLGLRVAVWVLTFAPLFLLGRPRLFSGLGPDDADRLLVRAAGSRSYLLRQLPATLKILACFAYFQDPGVRARIAGPPRPLEPA